MFGNLYVLFGKLNICSVTFQIMFGNLYILFGNMLILFPGDAMEELAEELDPLWFSNCYSQEMPTFGGGTEENLSPGSATNYRVSQVATLTSQNQPTYQISLFR